MTNMYIFKITQIAEHIVDFKENTKKGRKFLILKKMTTGKEFICRWDMTDLDLHNLLIYLHTLHKTQVNKKKINKQFEIH